MLAPKAPSDVVDEMKCGYDGKPVYFSISSDASNRRNRKMFPVIANYFLPGTGKKTVLIDFFEDHEENAAAVHAHLKQSVENNSTLLSCYN